MEMGDFRVSLPAFVPEEFGESLLTRTVKISRGGRDKTAGEIPGRCLFTAGDPRTLPDATFLPDERGPLQSCRGKI
jgi:hypothetical protein